MFLLWSTVRYVHYLTDSTSFFFVQSRTREIWQWKERVKRQDFLVEPIGPVVRLWIVVHQVHYVQYSTVEPRIIFFFFFSLCTTDQISLTNFFSREFFIFSYNIIYFFFDLIKDHTVKMPKRRKTCMIIYRMQKKEVLLLFY